MIRTIGCFIVTALFVSVAVGQTTIRLEAEDAGLIGNVRAVRPRQVATAPTSQLVREKFSGDGFVTGIQTEADKVIFRVRDVKAGLYSFSYAYTATSAPKAVNIRVNDLLMFSYLPKTDNAFRPHPAGRVELIEGDNTITFERGWGYYDIDYIELTPTKAPPPPKQITRELIDRKATREARELFAMLNDRYGKTCLSGVYSKEDADFVKSTTGQAPAIMGGDFMDYSPSRVDRVEKKNTTTDDLIAHARDGYILTISWHWNAPSGLLDKMIKGPDGKEIDARWYKGFNTNATTFDIEKTLADENSQDYKLLIRDIDAIAVQLKRFDDARIPILWRPLHEAEGKWFWWGAKGAEPYVKLWRLMHDRLTNHHNLHNLIWVYTGGLDYAWYPGDEFVDIVGLDAYPPDVRDPLGEFWDLVRTQYSDRKMLALSEFGGVPDIDRARRHGVYWLYFASWTGQAGPQKMKPEELKAIYTSPNVENRKQ